MVLSSNKLQTSASLFTLASVVVLLMGAGIFFYVSVQSQSYKPQVLGEVAAADNNSLFGPGVRLVKLANQSIVYAIVANQKYPIRNEEVFYSYDFAFKNVQTVSVYELDRYPLANLAKENGTGRIYYLSYGKNLKKYHPSPEAFNAYPGNKWGNIITLSQKDLSFWQQARLLKAVNDNKVYYVDGGNKAWIKSESEFINAGFSWSQVLTVFADDLNTYNNIDFSIDLVSKTNTVSDNSQSSTQPEISGGQLIVTKDAASPAASVLPQTTTNNIVSVFKMQAVDQNINVSSIYLTAKGVFNNDAINFVKIEDENGVSYGTLDRLENNVRTEVRFDEHKLIIPRGTEKKLFIKLGISANAQSNGVFSVGLNSINDVTASGTISGVFPIFGSEHKIVATQDFLGIVNVVSQEINSSLRYVNIGVKQDKVAKFRFTETSGNEDVAIYKIFLHNVGTASDDDLDYVYLYKDTTALAVSRYMVNGVITFDLTSNPLVIAKNDSVDLEVRVDIAKGEDKTLKFVIDKPDDVLIKGKSQNFNLVLQSNNGFPVGQGSGSDYNRIVFKRDGIGLFANQLSGDDLEIYRDTSNVSLGEFELRNISEDVYIQRLRIQVEKFNSAPDLTADIKLIDVSNSKEYSPIITIDKTRISGGVVADVNMGNFPVAAGQTIHMKVFSNVPDTAQSNNSYRIVIHGLTYKIGSDNTEYAYDNAVLGQIMRVFAPQLSINVGSLKNQGTSVSGEERVELANFALQASMDERVTIKSLTISVPHNSDDLTYTNGFANLALYVGSYRKSSIIAEPNSTTYTFNNLNIGVSAGRNISLMVKADVAALSSVKNIVLQIDDITAQGYSSKAPVLINNKGTASNPVSLTPVINAE